MLIKVSTIETFRTERKSYNAAGDCAVRAFATFFDVSYETARKELNKNNAGKDSVRGTLASAIEKALNSYAASRGIVINTHKLGRYQAKVKDVVRTEQKAFILASRHATACLSGVHFGNLNQEEATKYKDDANQWAQVYYTMDIVDINLYLSGSCAQ